MVFGPYLAPVSRTRAGSSQGLDFIGGLDRLFHADDFLVRQKIEMTGALPCGPRANVDTITGRAAAIP